MVTRIFVVQSRHRSLYFALLAQATIFLRRDGAAADDQQSLEDLETEFGKLDWDECARVAIIESKAGFKFKRQKVCSSKGPSQVLVAPGADDSVGATADSPIDRLFASILFNMETSNWEKAKEDVLKLQASLKLVSGRESRARGGWKYASDFVLDTVLFGDLVRSLQADADVMSKAIKLPLGFSMVCFLWAHQNQNIVFGSLMINW